MKSIGETPMKRRLLALLFGVLLLAIEMHAQAQVVVIANANVAATSITRAELRDIFTGASTSLNNLQVIPVLLKQGPVQEEFLSLYIGKSDNGFRAGWRGILFSGQGMMPKTLDTEAAVVEYVSHTPGAIGFIGRSTPHEGVISLSVR
jgi:ABC-type phosphate transport system substrate-binding protein